MEEFRGKSRSIKIFENDVKLFSKLSCVSHEASLFVFGLSCLDIGRVFVGYTTREGIGFRERKKG